MAGEKQFGTLKTVDCDIGGAELPIIIKGAIADGLDQDLDRVSIGILVGVPENCPRRKNFDSEQALGCLSCCYSYTQYEDGWTEV